MAADGHLGRQLSRVTLASAGLSLVSCRILHSTDREHHWLVNHSTEVLVITAQPHDGLVRIFIEPPQFLQPLIADVHQLLQLSVDVCHKTTTTLWLSYHRCRDKKA